MFLHIGNGITVRQKDIIGIFDLDTASVSSLTKRFLTKAEKSGVLLDAAEGEIPRSFLLVSEKKQRNKEADISVKLSLISSAALKLRVLRAAEETEE